jgi:hypothetical protein
MTKEGLIWFNVPEAYNYLKQNGRVRTLRDHDKANGPHKLFSSLEAKEPKERYKGKVKVEFTAIIENINDLRQIKIMTRDYDTLTGQDAIIQMERWALESGFNGVGQWVNALKDPTKTQHLYLVTKL